MDFFQGGQMKVKLSVISACILLTTACNPQKEFFKVVKDLGYIAYSTPLDSVGTGTIVKGKPKDLIVYTKPERCLPDILADGTHTKLRYQAVTDLPQTVKEVKVDFTAELSFFGKNGNPLFTVNPGATHVRTVEAKFSDAKVEFMDEVVFWNLYENRMPEECKAALLKNPVMWKALKIGKMEFTFKGETGLALQISAPMIKDIVKIDAGVSWSIKNNTTLTITTPKYIGFLAAQLTEEGVRTRSVNRFSNHAGLFGNFAWYNVKSLHKGVLKEQNAVPMY
jgi:hypothetical protein